MFEGIRVEEFLLHDGETRTRGCLLWECHKKSKRNYWRQKVIRLLSSLSKVQVEANNTDLFKGKLDKGWRRGNRSDEEWWEADWLN